MIWVYLNLEDITEATLARDTSLRQVRKDPLVFKIIVVYGSTKFAEIPSQDTPLLFQEVLSIHRLLESHTGLLYVGFTSENFGIPPSSRTGALYKWKICIANPRVDKEPDLGWAIHQAQHYKYP